jgi:membrane fusion protein (multidrug efflux system)
MTTPLVSVSDDRTMHVYFSLTENQILKCHAIWATQTKQQTAIRGTDAERRQHLRQKGTIDAISGIVDKSTGCSVRASFANPEHLLRSGNTGNIICLRHAQLHCDSAAATYELQDKVFVYKVVNGKTQSTKISVCPSTTAKNISWRAD